jgi:hypothetical protein
MPPYFAQFSPERIKNPGRVVFRWFPKEGRVDLGTQIDSVYWLSKLVPRDSDARWSRLDVSSGGNPEPPHTTTYTDVTGPLISTTGRVITQSWTFGATPPKTQTLTLDLMNVGRIAADVSRTGVATGTAFTADVTTDGPTTVELDNVAPHSVARIGGAVVAITTGTSITVDLVSGHTRVEVAPLDCASSRTGSVSVASGQALCVGPGARVTGPLTVKAGGYLDVDGGAVTGPLKSTGAAIVRLCGGSFTGSITVTDSTGLVLVGGDAATEPCAGNTITGAVKLQNNTAGVEFNGNRVTGPVVITGNTGTLPPPDTGPVHAEGNIVTGPVTTQH